MEIVWMNESFFWNRFQYFFICLAFRPADFLHSSPSAHFENVKEKINYVRHYKQRKSIYKKQSTDVYWQPLNLIISLANTMTSEKMVHIKPLGRYLAGNVNGSLHRRLTLSGLKFLGLELVRLKLNVLGLDLCIIYYCRGTLLAE